MTALAVATATAAAGVRDPMGLRAVTIPPILLSQKWHFRPSLLLVETLRPSKNGAK